jgi:hypothetical protein
MEIHEIERFAHMGEEFGARRFVGEIVFLYGQAEIVELVAQSFVDHREQVFSRQVPFSIRYFDQLIICDSPENYIETYSFDRRVKAWKSTQ